MLNESITAFVTLFVVIDPIGIGPLFIALTQGATSAERRRIGIISVTVAAGILSVFGLAGEAVLSFLGITMAAFRISGGMLLFMIALDMVFERRTQRRETRTAQEERGPANGPSIFPLATPMLAGPGSIATLVLLIGSHQGDVARQAMVFVVLYVLLILALAVFLLGGVIERLLRRTGILVVTRLLGMLLAALSVQFVLDGLAGFGLLSTG